MPMLERGSHALHYRVDGGQGPWLTFCNSLGTDLHMWDVQVAALSTRFRVLRYDRRGHGKSSAPPPPYALADLGDDVLALLDALDIERTHYCGISIGGQVAQWLAIHWPQRLDRVVICATASRIGSEGSWSSRIAAVQAQGLAPLREATAERWFGADFRRHATDQVEAILDSFVATAVPGYVGCCAALAGADLRAAAGSIQVPLFAIAGDEDPVCPPNDLRAIADACGGQLRTLPGRHLVNVESADAFNKVLLDFLE